MITVLSTTAWFLAGAATTTLFLRVADAEHTLGYTARPHFLGLPRPLATLARLGVVRVPVPDVLPQREPGRTLLTTPVGVYVHVTTMRLKRPRWWRRVADSFRADFVEHHGTRFLAWLADTRLVNAVVDTQDLVARDWELDEYWQTTWANNEWHIHHGAHRRADVDVPGSNWRSRWAEYVTQDWPTLASSADDILHPTDEWDVLRPVICTSRVNDVLRVSPLVGSTSC